MTPVPQSSYLPTSASPRVESEPSSTASSTPARNDLARLPLRRVVDAGPLTVDVAYTTRLPLKDWHPGVSKPLRLSLTAVNKRKAGQKIYLTKATATVTAFDADGEIDARTLTDAANISPGFIVTFPNTYNQTFAIPAVGGSATEITIDLTYEVAQEVAKDKSGRDFAKQVATDTIVVPLAP